MAAAPARLGRALSHVGSGVQRQSCPNRCDRVSATVESTYLQQIASPFEVFVQPETSLLKIKLHAAQSLPPSATPHIPPFLPRPIEARQRPGNRARKKPEENPASALQSSSMFDLSKLDSDNQARIRALREEDLAERARRFGKAKAEAWGPWHTFVPVAEGERRESLVPFTGCKCEGALGFKPGQVGPQHVGIFAARIEVDRLRHAKPGNDLGVGQAGEGAIHLVECQQMQRWKELVTKRRAQEEADRKKKRDEEAKKEAELEVRKILKIHIGPPKEEGRASLTRRGKKAALEIEASGVHVPMQKGEGSCDRARRLIRTLQDLKNKGMAPKKANGDGNMASVESSVGPTDVFRAIRNEGMSNMQKKLAQDVLKKEGKTDADGNLSYM